MIDENGLEIKGSQYYHYHHLSNGNVKIYNGAWNHVFNWYTYSDGDAGWDHPKQWVSDVDDEGNTYYHWKYDHDDNSATGYPTVSGNDAILTAGDGNDEIVNEADGCVLNGGAGDDRLVNSGDHVVITGGTGNDNIANSGDDVIFSHLGGNDVVSGFNAASKVHAAADPIVDIEYRGENVIFYFGTEEDEYSANPYGEREELGGTDDNDAMTNGAWKKLLGAAGTGAGHLKDGLNLLTPIEDPEVQRLEDRKAIRAQAREDE